MAKREVERILSKPNCKCYKQEIFLNLNFSLNSEDLPYFLAFNYKNKKSYANSGLFYIEDKNLIAFGAIGNNRLRIKCKNIKCFDDLSKLEAIIKEMPE